MNMQLVIIDGDDATVTALKLAEWAIQQVAMRKIHSDLPACLAAQQEVRILCAAIQTNLAARRHREARSLET